ncbi:TetR/AcrR family transcriptional regulator [Streptomyces sp. RB6PN25]|uniref:TetR/AcrR family transcriptional regulator n=1 Tax=Streptomyces humicola TaxID=2953240 RepID=A0ABT1PYT9_9ACTN|nr:TetR/AcrR family transcriptional regulator [Streptomyces humicola]MCQ4082827.1 TetR/AcrR family transcriptional regulator [Streptomyces humicola]
MDTAERLIESTRELLWERGYVGTSPRAILQRAGAGQGSMYHHFSGKEDLALAAVRRTIDQMRATADVLLSAPGAAPERITSYLRRERDVLRGCPVGRLTMDPEIIANSRLRQPVDELFGWLRRRLADVVAEGQARAELDPGLDPEATAAAVAATLQGGYVLARAAGSPEPFDHAVDGILALLTCPAT